MTEYRVGFEAISHLSIEELSKQFYDHFDGVVSERSGRIGVTVYATGSTGAAAACEAIRQLEAIGFSVVRTDHDLVDGPEVASRLGVTRQAVQNWAKGNRGSSFPHPVGFVGGKRIWTWSQVLEWAHREGRLKDEAPGLSQDELAVVDGVLATRRSAVKELGFRVDWMVSPGSMKPAAGLFGVEDYHQRLLRSPV